MLKLYNLQAATGQGGEIHVKEESGCSEKAVQILPQSNRCAWLTIAQYASDISL